MQVTAWDMVLLPGGLFEMGTPVEELERLQREFAVRHLDLLTPESPRHWVFVDPLYMDRYEVTNAQFRSFLEECPEWRPDRIGSRYHNGNYLKHWNGSDCPSHLANHPVVFVSWYVAMAYSRWVGERLPTEAEWEYAASGGLANPMFPWGDETADPSRANYRTSGNGAPVAVGSYPPNGYGLYDMAGNVWEFCLDEWQESYYASNPRDNPVAGGSLFPGEEFRQVKTRQVIRGGSWGGAPLHLRVAYRDSHPPEGAGDHVGFRCVKSLR